MDDKNTKLCSCGRGPVLKTIHKFEHRIETENLYYVCSYCLEESKGRFELDRKQEQELLLQLQILRYEIFSYFDSRYMEHWVRHFSMCGTKKEIWEILCEYGIIKIGRTSFYNRLRNQSLESYLRSLASIHVLSPILLLLEISDPYLIDKVQDAMNLAGEEYKYLMESRVDAI